MQRARNLQFVLLVFSLATALPSAVAQVVIATVTVGNDPYAVAVNTATNKTYVANNSDSTVTVIDGATNNTTTVKNVGFYPDAIAVNQATNKIYVASECGNDSQCNSPGTVTVIDGGTNNVVATVTAEIYPYALAVNSVANKIYVSNLCGNDPECNNSSPGTVTVIDGGTNTVTATVTAQYSPEGVVVNSLTNKIYVANYCGNDPTCASAGTVTVIDANSNNNTATVTVGVDPGYLALNSTTNKVYVSNNCGSCQSLSTVTVIDANNNNSTATVTVGADSNGIVVNAATNKIYVANFCGNDVTCSQPFSQGTVTVIDAANNNSTSSVNVGFGPQFIDIDSVTNNVYVVNYCGNDSSCDSPVR